MRSATEDRLNTGTDAPLDQRLSGDLDALGEFARELSRREPRARDGRQNGSLIPERINADQTNVEEGLTKLVLALIDLIRQLLEKQAVRRIDAGSLTEDQIERMGDTFLKLERKMAELKATLGVGDDDLTISLGPLRDLIAE
jgi:hypothetical protein